MASASSGSRFRTFLRSRNTTVALSVVAWIPVGIFFTRHVYSFAAITGTSMQPTFNPDLHIRPLHYDIVLLENWHASLRNMLSKPFRRGDVVTLWSPQDPSLLTTKRIIALEGDVVDPLPPSPPTPVRIPPGHCWVEGDSTYQTRDSNTYGPVSTALITARVSYVLWPWSRMGPVSSLLGSKARGRVRRVGPAERD